MSRVVIIKDIPSDQKDEVRIANEDGGATVTVIDQGDGQFTIQATYPNGDDPGSAPTSAGGPHASPINRDFFFSHVKVSFPLNPRQRAGLNAILDAWEATYAHEDDRWLAYALATTAWETGNAFQPIREIGRGHGKSYGNPDPETGQTYYGRGFVQLTHKGNYKRAPRKIGASFHRANQIQGSHALSAGGWHGTAWLLRFEPTL